MKRCLTPAFLMAVLLLGGAEIITRSFFARSMSGRFEYGYNPTAGFQERSDGSVHLVRVGGRHFRPQTYRQTPAPGTYRIMVVGDSVARGSNLETAYPARLAGLLKERGIPAEGWNLGIGGYGSHRKEVVLRQVLNYHPSLIILHVNMSNEFEDEREYKRSQEFKGWHPKNWLMKSLAIRRLYEAKTEEIYWRWLPQEIRVQNMVSDADAELAALMDESKQKVWLEQVKKNTAECVAMARAKGIPVLLITQGYESADKTGTMFLADGGLESLLAPVDGQGAHVFSMRQAMQRTNYKALYMDSSHLLPDGHQFFAAAIVSELERDGLLPAGARK